MQRNIFEGSEFLLYDIDNNPVALSTNCALKVKNNLIDITTKDSQNWKENLSSIKDWTIEFQGLISYDSSVLSTSFFINQFQAGDPFFIQMGVIQAGFTHTFWGEVAIESINLDADNGEVASYSGTLKGIGQLEFTNSGTPAQSGYLKVESDPVFRGSAAFNITNTNKTDWTDAYNKSPKSIGFATVGNQTTLSLTLRDGSVYSAPFNQIGGSGGGLTNLSFNPSNGVLTANSLTTNFDGRYQLAGNYVGLQYLSDNYYLKSNPDGYTTQSWVNSQGFIKSFTEVDTLDSVLGRGDSSAKNINVSGKAKFSTSLSIPNVAPSSPNSGEHYLYSTGIFGSTGSTGGSIVGILNDLNDVTITSATNGQALVYQSGQWVNQSVVTNLSNYYDKTQSDSRFKAIGYLPDWNDITGKPSFFDSQYSSLVGRPTNLSQFTNDLGNYGGFLTVEDDTLNSVLSRGNTSALDINVSGKAKFNGQLSIPTAAPSSPNSGEHYLYSTGTFGSTGSTGGSGGTFDYNELINKPNLNLYALTTGANATGTWGINISGTAAAATYATRWANQGYDATDISTIQTYILGYGADGNWHPTSNGAVRSFLGLGSIAYEDVSKFHRYNSFTADANTVPENTSNFSYAVNAPYTGTLIHFGANNYGTQFNTSYQGGFGLAFRTRNGDLNTWNPWNTVYHTGNILFSVQSSANSAVQRDANGYIFNSYINTTDDVNTSNVGYLLGKFGGDNYHRSFTAAAVQGWLGLGDLAYLNNSAIDLQFVTNRGNTTTQRMAIAFDGVASDPYGIMAVTRGTSSNYSYYGMTRSGNIGWGIGISTSNALIFGTNSVGGNNWTITSIPHSFDASGNAIHSNNIGAGGTLTVGGASYLKNTHIQSGSVLYQYNADNSLAGQSDMRSDTLHKYVYRISDAAPLSWKENWYNSTGAVYHSWSTDSSGFVANSKLTAISNGDGATTYAGALETRGVNAGITFHYPANYATSLYMNSTGALNWNGTAIATGGYIQGGRVIAGYDSGVVGSVSASSWFYSNGNTGWFNSTYGGGIHMIDSTYIRTYNGKILYVDNQIISNTQVISQSNGFKSQNFAGLVGDYDTNGTADKIIWTIGDGWNTIAEHYGLGYSYLNSLYSNNHQLVGRHAGGTTFSLNLTTGGAIFTGDVYSGSKVTAPTIKATQNLAIPNSPPVNPESGVHYLYSTS